MAATTLKSLHFFLRLLENAPELQRRMPTSAQPHRTIKESMFEFGRLLGMEASLHQDPRYWAAILGPQRLVIMSGQPSVTEHIHRVFESSKVLLTVLIDPSHFVKASPGSMGQAPGAHPQYPSKPTTATGSLASKPDGDTTSPPAKPASENALESLKPVLLNNLPLTCRLFKALFEHMLGFASPPGTQPTSSLLVNELTSRKEHNKIFLSTAVYILGLELDPDNLVPFMLEQDLLGIHIFELLLRNRDFCDAYYLYRRLERAFIGSPADEESQLRERIGRFSARFGEKPLNDAPLELTQEDKVRVNAHQAAIDLMEAMTFTPWRVSLVRAITQSPSHCHRSIKTIATHFERFAHGTESKEQANQEIARHLLAFSWQFLNDPQPPAADPVA